MEQPPRKTKHSDPDAAGDDPTSRGHISTTEQDEGAEPSEQPQQQKASAQKRYEYIWPWIVGRLDSFRDEWPSKVMAIFTVMIFCVTAAYTVYTRNQVRDVENQTGELHRQFIESERPYVWIQPGPPMPARSGKLWIIRENVQIVNYGKAPAFHYAGAIALLIAPHVIRLVDHTFSLMPKQADASGTVLPPGPDASIYTTLSRGMYTNKQMSYIASHDDAVVIVGRIWYRDAAGSQYTADFCMHWLPSGARAYCDKHNTMQ